MEHTFTALKMQHVTMHHSGVTKVVAHRRFQKVDRHTSVELAGVIWTEGIVGSCVLPHSSVTVTISSGTLRWPGTVPASSTQRGTRQRPLCTASCCFSRQTVHTEMSLLRAANDCPDEGVTHGVTHPHLPTASSPGSTFGLHIRISISFFSLYKKREVILLFDILG